MDFANFIAVTEPHLNIGLKYISTVHTLDKSIRTPAHYTYCNLYDIPF